VREELSGAVRMRGRLIAVPTVMRRGADLVVTALSRPVPGSATDEGAHIAPARWFVEFAHHHPGKVSDSHKVGIAHPYDLAVRC
jgi:hypothetical protein